MEANARAVDTPEFSPSDLVVAKWQVLQNKHKKYTVFRKRYLLL